MQSHEAQKHTDPEHCFLPSILIFPLTPFFLLCKFPCFPSLIPLSPKPVFLFPSFGRLHFHSPTFAIPMTQFFQHQHHLSTINIVQKFFLQTFLSFFLFYSQSLDSDKRVIFITFLRVFFYMNDFTVHLIYHEYHQIKTMDIYTNYDDIREKKIGCGDGRCCPCWTDDDQSS